MPDEDDEGDAREAGEDEGEGEAEEGGQAGDARLDADGLPVRRQQPQQRRRGRPEGDEEGRLDRSRQRRRAVRPRGPQGPDDALLPAQEDVTHRRRRGAHRRDQHGRPQGAGGLRHLGDHQLPRPALPAGDLEPRRRLGRRQSLRGRRVQRREAAGVAQGREGGHRRRPRDARPRHSAAAGARRRAARAPCPLQHHGRAGGDDARHRLRRRRPGLPRQHRDEARPARSSPSG